MSSVLCSWPPLVDIPVDGLLVTITGVWVEAVGGSFVKNDTESGDPLAVDMEALGVLATGDVTSVSLI